MNPIPDPKDEEIASLQVAVAKMKERGDRYAKNARNRTKEAARAKKLRDILRKGNQRHEHNLKTRSYRAPLERKKLIKITLEEARAVPDTIYLMDIVWEQDQMCC